jgi:molecular chaperone GrpE
VTDKQESTVEEKEKQKEPTNGKPVANGENGAANVAEIDVEALVKERDDLLDQLKRSVAEFANYRRRVDQERFQIREFASRDILGQVLPVLDDLQRALASVPEQDVEVPWVQGVRNIERKLAGLVERSGVTPIDALGQPFDPSMHEAVATEPGSTQNIVVEVYQPGYKLGQSLLRPAMVKVGDRPLDLSQEEKPVA